MPNVQITCLKTAIPRVGSALIMANGLQSILDDEGDASNPGPPYYWPFDTFANSEDEYDLAAVLLGRATEWEIDLDLTWSGSGGSYSYTAHMRGVDTVSSSAVTNPSWNVFEGMVTPVNPPTVPPAALEEEALAHTSGVIDTPSFAGPMFTDRSFENSFMGGPPVDDSAGMTFGVSWSTNGSIFGGNRIAPGFLMEFGIQYIGPAPAPASLATTDWFEDISTLAGFSTNPHSYPESVRITVGTLTIIWFNSAGGTSSVKCPLYATEFPTPGYTRSIAASVTITQTAGLQYGGTYLPSGEKA